MRAIRFSLKKISNKLFCYLDTLKGSSSLPDDFQTREITNVITETIKGQDVFFHAGLSKLKKVLKNDDPFSFLLSLARESNSFMAPAFTPSFRKTGVYHKKYSIPEYGVFSKLMMNHAERRTDDCIHSIYTIGDFSFKDCDHHDTFSQRGCYAKICDDNVLIVNIGTRSLVSTQFHYIERACKCPYVDQESFKGVIYRDDTDFSFVEQISYRYTEKYIMWDRGKIKKHLVRTGVLREYEIDGLQVSFFRAGDMFECISKSILKDPYFLIV